MVRFGTAHPGGITVVAQISSDAFAKGHALHSELATF